MNKTLKTLLIVGIFTAIAAGLVYKAMNPNDYQDPRYRTR